MHGQMKRFGCVVLALAGVLGLGGCNNAMTGGMVGAGAGALGGLAIGSLSGDAGKGAVIGAIAGGLGGAVIGDQNERRERLHGSGNHGGAYTERTYESTVDSEGNEYWKERTVSKERSGDYAGGRRNPN